MCFGGGGQIEKQAPANNGASLGMYQQQMRDQQSQLTAQLPEQINASNTRALRSCRLSCRQSRRR